MSARLMLVLASVTLAFAATEITLRACGCARLGLAIPATVGNLPFDDNPTGPFHFHYNSNGDRTGDPLGEGDRRESWCVAGDSHTNGLGVNDDDRLSETLQRLLNERGRDVVVFNVAVPGSTLPHYASMVKRCGSVYRARFIVVVLYLGNDLIELSDWIRDGRPDVDSRRPSGPMEYVKTVLRRSYVFDSSALVLHSVLDGPKHPSAGHDDKLQAYFQSKFYLSHPERRAGDLDVFDAELDEIKRAGERSGAGIAIATLPSWVQTDTQALAPVDRFEIALEREIVEHVRHSGISTIDLADALNRHRGQNQFWPTDRHLNSAGHRVVGQAIFDALGSDK